ncbi:MAG: hypothetical protein AABW87_03375, partial [Nanoarchaeota archaeon]
MTCRIEADGTKIYEVRNPTQDVIRDAILLRDVGEIPTGGRFIMNVRGITPTTNPYEYFDGCERNGLIPFSSLSFKYDHAFGVYAPEAKPSIDERFVGINDELLRRALRLIGKGGKIRRLEFSFGETSFAESRGGIADMDPKEAVRRALDLSTLSSAHHQFVLYEFPRFGGEGYDLTKANLVICGNKDSQRYFGIELKREGDARFLRGISRPEHDNDVGLDHQ